MSWEDVLFCNIGWVWVSVVRCLGVLLILYWVGVMEGFDVDGYVLCDYLRWRWMILGWIVMEKLKEIVIFMFFVLLLIYWGNGE